MDRVVSAPHARHVSAPTSLLDGTPHTLSRTQALDLQTLAGNRAVAGMLGRRPRIGGVMVAMPLQRRPSWWPAPASTGTVPSGTPPTTSGGATPTGSTSAGVAGSIPGATTATAAPTWPSIDAAATALVKAVAEGDGDTIGATRTFIFSRLNGMNPEALVAELGSVQRLDALYRVIGSQKGVDVPRLSTAIAGVMSKKPEDTVAALQMLDQLRSSGGSEAFWTDQVAQYTNDRLRKIFLVSDRKVITALRDALDKASPEVHRKVGPLLAMTFDPPASDIVLEFVPDQFDQPALITLPDGTQKKGYAPIGNLTAKVRGRVAANVPAQGGMWQSQDAGGGHHADPTRAGTHTLGAREKVRTSFWQASQIAQETPLREGTKAGKKIVEYQGEDHQWHDTMSLAVPISRDQILEYVKGLRNQLTDAAALALVPDGVVPKTWIFNDFGDHAYRILGTDQLVHTSPGQEVQFKAGIQEDLGWSHGCLHLKPSGRDQLEKMHLLKGGVTLKVHAYIKGVKEYGKAPGF